MLKCLVQKVSIAGAALFLVSGLSFADAKQDEIEKGQYLSRMGGCASCHTAPGRADFAGGRELPTPFGAIYSTNITPHRVTGIGAWNFEDFWNALHHGKGKKGELLYPAFPFTSYTKINRADARALFTYLQSVDAVDQANQKPELGFPYNIRAGLYAWRALYFKAGEYEEDASKSEAWNRGAYLVQGPGHCNECHTTRNALGAVDQSGQVVGGLIPGQDWYAPNLSMQPGGDLASWSKKDIVDVLKTGMSSKGSALGPMAEVVHNSSQYMSDSDLAAVAEYLADLPAPVQNQVTVVKAQDLDLGKKIYTAQCESCHAQTGLGEEGVYPSLVNNPTVLEQAGTNAIRVVLLGGFSVETQHSPEPYSMPPFAATMSDAEVTAVVNYIRQTWGNNATAIDEEAVKYLRKRPAF